MWWIFKKRKGERRLALLYQEKEMRARLLKICSHLSLRMSLFPTLLELAGWEVTQVALNNLVEAAFKELKRSIGDKRGQQYYDKYQRAIKKMIVERWTR